MSCKHKCLQQTRAEADIVGGLKGYGQVPRKKDPALSDHSGPILQQVSLAISKTMLGGVKCDFLKY